MNEYLTVAVAAGFAVGVLLQLIVAVVMLRRYRR